MRQPLDLGGDPREMRGTSSWQWGEAIRLRGDRASLSSTKNTTILNDRAITHKLLWSKALFKLVREKGVMMTAPMRRRVEGGDIGAQQSYPLDSQDSISSRSERNAHAHFTHCFISFPRYACVHTVKLQTYSQTCPQAFAQLQTSTHTQTHEHKPRSRNGESCKLFWALSTESKTKMNHR